MSTYCVSIGQREYKVQITDTHPLLNGEPVPCDLVSINGNGMHQLSRGNRRLEVYLSSQPNGVYEAYVGGRRIVAHVDLPHRHANRPNQTIATGDLKAPMPGLVVEIPVREGDTVQNGQVILVEESMKMQMQLRAPFIGRVDKIVTAPGTQVDKGALLIKLTPL